MELPDLLIDPMDFDYSSIDENEIYNDDDDYYRNKRIKLYSIKKEYSTNEKFDLENLIFDAILNVLKYLNFMSLYKLWSCHNKYINNIIENYHSFTLNLADLHFNKNNLLHKFLPNCKHISGIDTQYDNKCLFISLQNCNDLELYKNYINFNNLVYIHNFPIFSENDLILLQSPVLLELSIMLTFYFEKHLSFNFIKSKILKSLTISSEVQYIVKKKDFITLPPSLQILKCLSNVYFENGETLKYVSENLQEFTGYLSLKLYSTSFHYINEQQKLYFSSFPSNMKKLTLIPTRMANFDYELLNYIPISKNMIEFNYTTKIKSYTPISSWIITEFDMLNAGFVNLLLVKFLNFNNLQVLRIENERLKNEDLKYLPNSLQELEIPNAHFTPELFSYLPQNLKTLTIRNNFRRYFPYYNKEQQKELSLNPYCYMLPKNLQKLILYPLDEFFVTKNQYNYYWQKLCSSSKKNFNIPTQNDNNDISILDIIPKNVGHLELHHFYYPLKSKDFTRLNDKMVYLKILEIDYMTSKFFKYCPKSLINLQVDCKITNLKDFEYLPKNLKELTIKCINVEGVKKKLIPLINKKYTVNIRSYLDFDLD